jgi:hypothetical protein
MSGRPFTIFNSNIDVDQNGELVDPSPAGSYSGVGADAMTNVENKGGRNGAIGPDYLQLDMRVGWRRRIKGEQAVELFLDIFNVTNRANFDNPAGDERVASTFLIYQNLRGGGGFPRQAKFGVRYTF